MIRTVLAVALLAALCAPPVAARKTSLLADEHLAAIAAEASGSLAKDTVVELATMHRVHGSAGFRQAATIISLIHEHQND